jgi:hypothetical protein
MNIKLLIGKNLDNAFKLLKSQVVSATVNKKNPDDFDFSTASVPTNPSTLNVSVIELNSKRKRSEKSVEIKQILLKTTEAPDITFFDEVVINNITWSIGNVIANGKFVTLLEISRGV